MPPHEAADVLGELGEETSQEILEEMSQEPKSELRELLEFDEDSAGGLMSREFIAVSAGASVAAALAALHTREELPETLNTIFLTDEDGRLMGAVPVSRLLAAPGHTPLRDLVLDRLITVHEQESQDRIVELFDKYNLLTLPVVDDQGNLSGAITADEIITVLRQK